MPGIKGVSGDPGTVGAPGLQGPLVRDEEFLLFIINERRKNVHVQSLVLIALRPGYRFCVVSCTCLDKK